MSLLKTNEIQNYNGSSLTLTASTVSTSAQLNTGGNISVTGSLNVSDDSTTRTNLGLGTIATQDSDSITVTGGTATLGALTVSGSDSGNLVRITQTGSGNALVVEDSANPDSTPFVVNASGNVLIGTTIASTVGENLQVFRDNAEVASFLRYTDGTLVNFKTGGGAIHGSISISGVTCSYNSFAGSHWSQLKDGSKSEILCGTVMEAIDELVEWPNEPTNSNLCKVKISDNAGTKKVYGVFMGWDEDWTATNDMLVTALGAFLCRVNNSEIVHQGDLLESNGDGTARVQSDDVIRSSTIGKVTSTAKTLVYDDGSYCVPTVLYCG